MSELPKIRRAYRRIEEWECIPAGMYDEGFCVRQDRDRFLRVYADFLADRDSFQIGIERCFVEWPVSCENFLTDCNINRIAWLGQASACIEQGLPCSFRGGFWLLSKQQQDAANKQAFDSIKEWILAYRKHQRASRELRERMESQMLFSWGS